MKLGKKVLALMLALLMVLAVTACAGDSKEPSKAEESSSKSAGSSVESSDAGNEEKTYDEKMVISLASVQIEDGRDYTYGDDFTKYWAEKFNVEWEITSLTWENWAERLRVWINSDDMPDWAVWNYVHGEAVTYAEQGLVKEMPENWETTYPNLAEAAANTSMNAAVAEELGGTYFLFRPVYANNRPSEKLSTHMTLYARQDWADEIGFELKDAMKWSEIIDFAAQLKEKNPGNVQGNFYPISIRPGNIYTVQNNSTYSGINGPAFYLGEDGNYQWGGASEDTLTGLKLYSQMYRDGLLSPEFYTLQSPDDIAAFYVEGTAGISFAEGMAAPFERYAAEMRTNLGIEWDDCVRTITMLGEDGYYHGAVVTNYWAVNAFSSNIEEEKFERLLDIMDYSCTEEAQRMIRMGFEGVDWEVGENGEFVSLLEGASVVTDKYAIHPVYGNMMVLSDDFQFINPQFSPQYRERVKEMYVIRDELSTEETLPSEPDNLVQFYSSTALNLASMVYTDEYAALITKDGDIETVWKAWIDEKMNLIQPVLDDLNSLK